MTRPAAILSTGDAGAARGALEAAAELDLKIGGWTAADLPPPYAEHTRRTLAPRMAARLNVQDSDGTLIVSFAPGLTAGGPAAYADEAIEHQRKASLHVVLPEGGRSTIPEDVRKGVLAWIAEEKIATLHVTGPREADEPGIQQAVRDALVWIFEDEVVQPSPRAQAFAEQVIGPMVEATFAGVDRAALPDSLRLPDAELVRLGVGLAALPSPTHIAINPEHVDAAIAAGLDVQWLLPGPTPPDVRLMWQPPPKVPAEVYAERDRLLGEISIGLPGDNVSLDPIVIDDKPDHDYLSAGDTPYADGDRCYTGCFLCGRSRREHRKI